MNTYFGDQMGDDQLGRQLQQQHEQQQEPPSSASGGPMVGGDSLDDIIQNNTDELQRRRSVARAFNPDQPPPLSMMEFGSPSDAFRDYQFDSNTLQAPASFPTLDVTTTTSYPDQSALMPMSPTNTFPPLSPDMMGSMMAFSNLNVGPMGANPTNVGLYAPPALPSEFAQAPAPQMPPDLDQPAMSANNPDSNMVGVSSSFMAADAALVQQQSEEPAQSLAMDQTVTNFPPSAIASPLSAELSSGESYPPIPVSAPTVTPQPADPAPPPRLKEKNIYSKSGFDMLRAFWYVGTRKNPTINLGAVDMSCSFVVCDVTLNDCPIIYVSDNFQNLTGYSRHEILGKNCRFLQAPDGKVEAGSRREFVDNRAVFKLKQKITEGREVQQSLINYRKGGKPFLNLLTMIPIPWDTDEIRYFIGFQIDLVECPDAISAPAGSGGFQVDYKHSDIGQYIWTPPSNPQWEPEKTLGVDDVSTLLQQFNPKGTASDWHRQSWDKMLLENADDVVHVLSLKGLFLYLSPSCKKVLEYDTTELVGNSLSSVCHPSDIVPVTRELKDTAAGGPANIVFRIRRKQSGYTWFESHGSLFVEQGKGRKYIILVGRKRPVFALSRRNLEANGGIGDSELWTKLSTSGMFLFVSSNVRSLLDLQPENLVGTSIQDLMRRESRAEFGRAIEKARRGKIVTCKHEVHNRRGQVLQSQTILYPGDAGEGEKPTFLLAQTKLVKASSRSIAPGLLANKAGHSAAKVSDNSRATISDISNSAPSGTQNGPSGSTLTHGNQDAQLASDDNIFDELKTTRCTSWQYELRQMEKLNRVLAEELAGLLSSKKKRKRRKGSGNVARDCANCHTRNTPEWRRGPSGHRDLCNSCGLRWAKQTGRVSPRNSSRGGNGDTQSKLSNSPIHSSPLHREVTQEASDSQPASDTNGTIPASVSTNNVGVSTSLMSSSNITPRTMPPPSQPMLEGGSGVEMTAIREERETST